MESGMYGRNRYEIFKTICGDPECYLHWRDHALFYSTSDTGKCIWTGALISGTDKRMDQSGGGTGDRTVSDRDYAADVYPGCCRDRGVLGTCAYDACTSLWLRWHQPL